MKILVVEDELEVLRVLNKQLTADGHQVFTANCGQDAIKTASVQRPDLILIDIMLPDVDGPDVIKHLAENPLIAPSIPTIFFSGIVSKNDGQKKPEVVVNGRKYPAIAKPFTYEELKQKMISVCAPKGT